MTFVEGKLLFLGLPTLFFITLPLCYTVIKAWRADQIWQYSKAHGNGRWITRAENPFLFWAGIVIRLLVAFGFLAFVLLFAFGVLDTLGKRMPR